MTRRRELMDTLDVRGEEERRRERSENAERYWRRKAAMADQLRTLTPDTRKPEERA